MNEGTVHQSEFVPFLQQAEQRNDVASSSLTDMREYHPLHRCSAVCHQLGQDAALLAGLSPYLINFTHHCFAERDVEDCSSPPAIIFVECQWLPLEGCSRRRREGKQQAIQPLRCHTRCVQPCTAVRVGVKLLGRSFSDRRCQ
eukprot:CAMPEP_0183351322 /NCGR_PEP_ID=MMETSP0164_2-20130417/23869_1 /TAXON_ID=221442 /ORGANISM="Coccolithus pelagicus ssp braarudi, Strain PLY182g" /LENGTH=142 /DNA_ID=CAMNT_0025523471 /DNA_START=746 /DNA_END=1174 /DNA_ORIENTATION=-